MDVVPLFQNPCTATSPQSSFGTIVRVWDWVPALSPSANGAALFPSPPPLLVPVPEYILGSYETQLGVRAVFPNSPHSSATLLWRMRTKPPLAQLRACWTVRCRLYLNSSWLSSVQFKRFGITVSQAPVSAPLSNLDPTTSGWSFFIRSSAAFSLTARAFQTSALLSLTQALWAAYCMPFPSTTDVPITSQHALDVA
eukprot:7271996-Ditylum_brightwellii.AAC.1